MGGSSLWSPSPPPTSFAAGYDAHSTNHTNLYKTQGNIIILHGLKIEKNDKIEIIEEQ